MANRPARMCRGKLGEPAGWVSPSDGVEVMTLAPVRDRTTVMCSKVLPTNRGFMRNPRRLLTFMMVLGLVVVSCGSGDGQGAEANDLADLQTAAIVRLLTTDNSFGADASPFTEIEIGSNIGGDANRPLEPSTFENVTAALPSSVEVAVVADVEATIQRLFEQDQIRTAVASIEDLRINGSRAELDMRLWCGSLCGVFLTYEAEVGDIGWTILGTTGPIAMS
jgi:hypothetical protein